MLLSSPGHNIMEQTVCLSCFCEISDFGHAAAILFKVELYVRMGRTEKAAVTSGVCMWKDISRKEVRPAPLREISFHKPKRLSRQLPAASTSARKSSITPRGM